MSFIVISHPLCQQHEMVEGHSEQPARIDAVNEAIDRLKHVLHMQASPASRAQIERVHSRDYVDKVYQQASQQGDQLLNPDTHRKSYSLDAALHAAGAVVQGVDLLLSGHHKRIFCNVRPPGHHAESNQGMGGCIFNNIAIGVLHARRHYGVGRIAIVDFDVHHGNGTEQILQNDTSTLFCSSFQHPFYPYSGADTESEHILNLPLPADSEGDLFRYNASSWWLPKLYDFKPHLILISAGFGAHSANPRAKLNWQASDYTWITNQLVKVANYSAHGSILSVLEGGDSFSALSESAEAHLRALQD
ncbi:MAG: histone deacetylase family protein [Luminiphilus sp.]